MRSNVEDQQGWLILSPRAKQVVVHTGHAVEEADPALVTNAILEVVRAARTAAASEATQRSSTGHCLAHSAVTIS